MTIRHLAAAVVVALLAATLVLSSHSSAPRSAGGTDTRASIVTAGVPWSDDAFSVIDLHGQWDDAYGHANVLQTPSGKPFALAMVYTHCTASCPITVGQLQRVEAQLGDSMHYVVVSLDPTRDDGATLRAWGARFGLSSRHWSLLRGSADDVRSLAAALGIRYQADSIGGDIAHSNAILLFDGHGVLRGRFDGTEPGAVASAARMLLGRAAL